MTGQKKYLSLMLLTAYRAAGLRVNMQRDNTEIDIKEMALMTSGLNRSMFNLKITVIRPDI